MKLNFLPQKHSLLLKISTYPQIIETDSRKIKPGEWFLPLKGINFDGHSFLKSALDKGATGAFCNPGYNLDNDPRLIEVPNVENFLWDLAKTKREEVNPILIAITGSNGKTTTRELLTSVFSKIVGKKFVHSTSKNENNHFGVPFTLLQMPNLSQIAIVEIGSNHPGEIAPLSKLVQPNIAIITSIAHSHIAHFDGIEAIAKEKAEITAGLKSGGAIITPDYFDYQKIWQKKFKGKNWYPIPLTRLKKPLELNGNPIINNLKGDAALWNGNLVLSLWKEKGIQGMEKFSWHGKSMELNQITGRLNKIPHPILEIWDDSYNANLDSMKNALKFFTNLRGEVAQKMLILGEMGELGEWSEKEHKELGKLASGLAKKTIFVFKNQKAAISFSSGWKNSQNVLKIISNKDFTEKNTFEFLKNSTVFLIKGSRMLNLERCLSWLNSIYEK